LKQHLLKSNEKRPLITVDFNKQKFKIHITRTKHRKNKEIDWKQLTETEIELLGNWAQYREKDLEKL